MSKEVASLKDYIRMCCTINDCSKCPMDNIEGNCPENIYNHFDEANELILKWCEEHPIKTYKMDFLEKFPNAILNSDNSPRTCRNYLYGICNVCTHVELKCSDCWNEPMEEK